MPGVTPWKTGSDGVGPSDHARTDGDGGDLRDNGGTDQALPAERFRLDHAGDAAIAGTRGREELLVRSQATSTAWAIKVDTSKLNQAHVLIQGTEVPLSATSGWNVDASNPTTLIFSGAACATWRLPSSTTLDLQFPCGSIIFE